MVESAFGPSNGSRSDMSQALRDIPTVGRWTLGLHLLWGVIVILGLPLLGESVSVARPVLVASWFGTSTMLMVFGLVVASGGWRRNETWYLTVLLTFDAAAAVIVVELLRIG